MAEEKVTQDDAKEEADAAPEESKEETTEEANTADASEEATETAKEEKQEEKKEEVKEEKEESTPEASDDDGGEEVEVPEKFKAIVTSIEEMSVLDLHELVKLLEKKFGVSAAAVAVAGAGGAEEAGDVEEKSDFTVELKDVGGQKIAVIKIVKEVLGLGLKEAKELVDGAPAVLKEGMPKEEAEEFKSRIEEAGGSIELK